MPKAPARGRLIIVCGLPGSGKTTYAQQLEAKLDTIRLCADDWMGALGIDLWDEPRRERIEALQWQFGQKLLALGLTVVVEWGTWGKFERDALRLRARELGALVELHYLSSSVDALFDRIQRRCLERPPIKREQLLQWAGAFQIPTAEEQALFDRAVTVEV